MPDNTNEENPGINPESAPDRAPEGAPDSPDTVIERATAKLQDLRSVVERKAAEAKNAVKMEERLEDIGRAIDATGNVVSKASKGARDRFSKEVDRFQNTIKDLPSNEVKNKGISLYGRMKGLTKRGYQATVDGISYAFGKVAELGQKLGELFHAIIERMKPSMSRLVGLPFMKYVVGGERNVQILQDLFGYDEQSLQIMDDFNERSGGKMELTITNKTEKKTFQTLLDDTRGILNKATYTQGNFIEDVMKYIKESDLRDENGDGKKELNMTQFATAARAMMAKAKESLLPAK